MMIPSNFKIRRKAIFVFVVGSLFFCFILYKKLSDDWGGSSNGEYRINKVDNWVYHERKKPLPYVSADSVLDVQKQKVFPRIKPSIAKKADIPQPESSPTEKEVRRVNPKVKIEKPKVEIDDEKAAQEFKLNRILQRRLRQGLDRSGKIVIHIGNLTVKATDQSAMHMAWQKDLGVKSNYEVNSFGHFPEKFRPESGNGHISAVPFSNRLHVNGLFDGRGKESRRARFPTIIVENITRVTINKKEVQPLLRRYSLNMADGVFTQVMVGVGVIIEQRIYAHRNYTPLYIHEIDIYGDDESSKPMSVRLEFSGKGVPHDSVSDAPLSEAPNPFIHFKSFTHRHGELVSPEDPKNYPNQENTIHLMSTDLPSDGLVVELDAKVKRKKWIFLMSVASKETIAREYFELGLQMILKGDWLYLTHLDTWHDIWDSGRVQIENSGDNSNFPSSVISAQYYILSSLPWRPHEGYKFAGLSPGGLGHGDGVDDRGFMGHVYWDQDFWMFPPIMLLHPKLSRLSMLKYRVDRLPQAMQNAKMFKLKGAKFPWESGWTGKEMTRDPLNERHQHHVTGAVMLAVVNYILANNDTQFLVREGGDHMLIEGARFWRSRLTKVKTTHSGKNATYRYEIWDIMGPDEHHERVNNSAYSNALAQACLRAPARVKRFTGGEITEEMVVMEKIADKIYVPFNKKRRFHPEFDGYKSGSKIKQADTILLGYPLNYIFDFTERRNDLIIYQKVLDNGPGMSWGMHAIGWLELKDEEKAWASFKQQFMHIRPPFKVWSEYSSGGRVNFITAAGGFLQSVMNGYFGLRLRNNGLYFDSTLPPQTTNASIFGLNYLGNSIDLVMTEEVLMIRCSGHDPLARRLETEIFRVTPRPLGLSANRWVTLQRGRGVIRAMADGSRWPNRRWRLRRNLVDEDVHRVSGLARQLNNQRQSLIDAWRRRTDELIKQRQAQEQKRTKKEEVPIEEQVALRLKQKAMRAKKRRKQTEQ